MLKENTCVPTCPYLTHEQISFIQSFFKKSSIATPTTIAANNIFVHKVKNKNLNPALIFFYEILTLEKLKEEGNDQESIQSSTTPDPGVYLFDFFCSGIQFYLLLSPYLCFISFLYIDLYVLGDDALIS